jgi:hypothetical protein
VESRKLMIEVELDIFSGEPNPKWELLEEQIEELEAKLRVFFASTKPQTPPPLGYRGFFITNFDRNPMIPEQIHAYNGVLTIMDKARADCWKDESKIEEWLISQARELGYGKIIDEDRQHDS